MYTTEGYHTPILSGFCSLALLFYSILFHHIHHSQPFIHTPTHISTAVGADTNSQKHSCLTGWYRDNTSTSRRDSASEFFFGPQYSFLLKHATGIVKPAQGILFGNYFPLVIR